jgi:hypothetical protein
MQTVTQLTATSYSWWHHQLGSEGEKEVGAAMDMHQVGDYVLSRMQNSESCLLVHDLNNDLTVLLGRCEMLGDLVNAEAMKHLRLIQEAAHHMTDRIADRPCLSTPCMAADVSVALHTVTGVPCLKKVTITKRKEPADLRREPLQDESPSWPTTTHFAYKSPEDHRDPVPDEEQFQHDRGIRVEDIRDTLRVLDR